MSTAVRWSVAAGLTLALVQAPALSQTAPNPYTAGDLERITDNDAVGSTNVPMDSWIYPALERLAAMGFIPSRSVSIRPWTRVECRRQVREAEESIFMQGVADSLNLEAERLLGDLRKELEDNDAPGGVVLESVYSRFGTIAGPALNDSYHFGQTWWNDFGRPLGRGSSVIDGFSVRATHGRFFFYAREEAQHDPGVAAQSPALVQTINDIDREGFPRSPLILPITPRAASERYRPLELYAGMSFGGNALSFGKQELYWGPSLTGPFSFSSNAEPTYNLRFVSTRPHPFPGPFATWGTYRVDLVAGKLSGHHYPARPYYNGQKLDLTLGSNIEMSVTRWSLLCGVGHPCTFHEVIRNLGSGGSAASVGYGDPTDPGDRKSGFDFRFTPPGISRLVTLYADSYADDEIVPIETPNRSAFAPGIYFARLPYLPRMDLRVEAPWTTPYAGDARLGGYLLFWNLQYLDANTNKGFLLGNAVGRDGKAVDGRLGYWISGRSRIEAGYRQNKGGIHFLPGGATISDAFVNASYGFRPDWTLNVFAQYERFLIPSYTPGAQHNESGWFQIMYSPKLKLKFPPR